MIKEYLIIGTMALLYSGIIFSLIFKLLLKDNKKNSVLKLKIRLNYSLLDNIDQFLRFGGYWSTVEMWMGIQLLFFLTACVVGIRSSSLTDFFMNALGTFVALELILYFAGKFEMRRRNNVLNLDLCRLQETLFFQSDTGVEKESILLAVYEDLEDVAFRKAIKEIVFAYSFKQDVIEKIEALKSISNNMNMIIFANTLIQDFQIGEAEENIEAQATVMRRLISNRAIIEKKASRFKVIVIGLVLMIFYVFLTVTPLLLEFTNNINKITS